MTREEAINRIKERLSKEAWCTDETDIEALSEIIPELKESEDERIRKKLIEIVSAWKNREPHGIGNVKYISSSKIDKINKILAWLEKQKEQNVVPSRETILGIWELGNLWKENPEEREGLTQLQYIQKYWFEKCDYQKEQNPAMIQWTGKNLKEVINFTGKSPRFGEWFKSWDDFENYVHAHNDILKLFCEDGSHYEVPVGAWIVKTPDGFNIPSLFRFVQKPAESGVVGRRGRRGLTPEPIRKKAEEFQSKMAPPYDADDICSAYETGAIEQKPVININHLKSYMLQYLQDAANRKDDGEIEADTDYWAKKILELMEVDQKPAEWSEEDETCLEDALWCVMKTRHFVAKDACDLDACRCAERWLELLPERFNFQSKQEWSEEDEKMRQHIISDLREFRDCETDEELISDYEDEICWLKSLRSNHWKPSEEQMKALEDAKMRMSLDGYGLCPLLQTLVNDLKKL